MIPKTGGSLDYWFLRKFFPRHNYVASARALHLPDYESRLSNVVGKRQWQLWKKQTIVDFGCGHGEGAVELAVKGAKSVVGVDIRPSLLDRARSLAIRADVSDRCQFTTQLPNETADIVVSIDAFEHFDNPVAILNTIAKLLVPGGRAIISFGPTWYHPLGGHIFSPFPWAHLLFSESTLCRWRRDFREDGAMRFCEVEGGLNRMTIARFERIAQESPLQVERLFARPIRSLRFFHHRWTREFLTSVVESVLIKRTV